MAREGAGGERRSRRRGEDQRGADAVTPFEKDVDELIKTLRTEGWEQQRIARGLSGAERSAALTHANVKEADANRLRRLMWQHGLGVDPGMEKKKTGARR